MRGGPRTSATRGGRGPPKPSGIGPLKALIRP